MSRKTQQKVKGKGRSFGLTHLFEGQSKPRLEKNFFEIIKKHFNKKCKFSKIINRNNVKLSYSCMPNIASIIKRHNNKIMKTNCKKLDDSWNCRKKESCPMKGGNCRRSNVIYEASIITNNNTKTYIGLSSNEIIKKSSHPLYNH